MFANPGKLTIQNCKLTTKKLVCNNEERRGWLEWNLRGPRGQGIPNYLHKHSLYLILITHFEVTSLLEFNLNIYFHYTKLIADYV